MRFNVALFVMLNFTIGKVMTAYSQDEMYYATIQGTWDKQKDQSRAQFGGNNVLINTYFHNYRRDIWMSGSSHMPGTSVTGEISFRVNGDGSVDSIRMVRRAGQMYDSTMFKIIKSTSGKWRVGQKEGVKQNEVITLWFSVYKGPKLKMNLEEYISAGNESIQKGDFKKAMKYSENALEYDPLNVDAIIIQIKAMVNLNQQEQACNRIKAFQKYNSEKITSTLNEYCR